MLLEKYDYDIYRPPHDKEANTQVLGFGYWPLCHEEDDMINMIVRNCDKCQLNKVKIKNREPLFMTPTPQSPFDILVVDTIGPLPVSVQ